jgi:16S rRNA (uracil1498-N3)-methyltransferase
VTAALFLCEDVSDDVVVLTGPEGRHAATVRRVQVGEAVDLADGRGTRAHCTVVGLGHDTVELRVRSRVVEPAPAPWLVVAQGIAKGERGELAVELATEVGVDEVLPWAAARCVVKWEGARGERALARWRSTAREAGKQSRRARHPVVAEPVDLDALVARAAAATTLVLHEEASVPLASVPLPADGEVLLVVGPEGGITPRELERLTGAGATAVRLGASVLRTSTAGAAAAAVVSARTPRWA